MTQLQSLLSEIKSRLEAATPGPWKAGEVSWGDYYGPGKFGVNTTKEQISVGITGDEQIKSTSNLIASAPTDLAKLCKIVEVLSEALDEDCSCKLPWNDDDNDYILCRACHAIAKGNEIAGE